jgi:serine/threonine protein kinase
LIGHDSGKFSVVHVVTHKALKKDYAAKMIDRSLCDNEELAKEVAIMQDIEEHPGVIHLKDVYEEAGSSKFVLILELYVGHGKRKSRRGKNPSIFLPFLIFLTQTTFHLDVLDFFPYL